MSISVQQTPAPCGFPQSQVLHIHCRHSQIRCYGRAVQRNLIANCLSCSCHEQGVEVLLSRVYSLLFAAVSVFTHLASFQFAGLLLSFGRLNIKLRLCTNHTCCGILERDSLSAQSALVDLRQRTWQLEGLTTLIRSLAMLPIAMQPMRPIRYVLHAFHFNIFVYIALNFFSLPQNFSIYLLQFRIFAPVCFCPLRLELQIARPCP